MFNCLIVIQVSDVSIISNLTNDDNNNTKSLFIFSKKKGLNITL